MRAADCIVDIGPGAGEHGGKVVAIGTAEDIMKCEESITGAYLSGRMQIPVPSERRKPCLLYTSIPRSTRTSAPTCPRARCWWALPEPVKPCWHGRWQERLMCRSSPFPVQRSWRCSWEWARPRSGICSSRPRKRPPVSCSSTRSTPSARSGTVSYTHLDVYKRQAKVFAGDESGFAPCTAEAVMEVLRPFGVSFTGFKDITGTAADNLAPVSYTHLPEGCNPCLFFLLFNLRNLL